MTESSSSLIVRRESAGPAPWEIEEMEKLLGTVIDSQYRLVEILGTGGAGVVFKALHVHLKRHLVVKVLRPRRLSNEQARRRLEREAERLCLLDHPNVVRIYGSGYHDDSMYIALNYLEGMSLSQFIASCGPLPIDTFTPIAAEILSGLGAVHRAGLIHRDIKPQNIMLCVSGGMVREAKLIDFGLARLIEETESLTGTQDFIGTISTVAPEHIMGDQVDSRGDMYSFGVLAYEMLCGVKPFEGDPAQVCFKHVHQEPPPLKERLPADHEVPDRVIRVIARCLSKDPARRPGDAIEALQWLRSAAGSGHSFSLAKSPVLARDGKALWKRQGEDYSHSKTVHSVPSWMNHSVDILQGTDESPARSWGAIVASALVIMAIAAAGLWLIFRPALAPAPGETPVPNAAPVVAPEDHKPRVSEKLALVDQALQAKRFGAAEKMLAMIGEDYPDDTDVTFGVAERRAKLNEQREKYFAERMFENHRLEEAVDIYRGIFRKNPREDAIVQRLSRLEDIALLEVNSNVAAEIFLDDKSIGKTPLVMYVEAGATKITAQASGRASWTKTLRLRGGHKHQIDATLRQRRKRRKRTTTDAPANQPDVQASAEGSTPSSSDQEFVDEFEISIHNEKLMPMMDP